MMIRKGLGLLMVGFFVSCSVERPHEPFDPDLCNEQAGYERGYEDGTKGRTMSTEFARHCRDDLRDVAFKGYRSGFDVGNKELKERMAKYSNHPEEAQSRPQAQPQQPPRSFFPNVNINIGGGRQVISQPTDQKNDRAYFCHVEAFMHKFEDFGSTMLEAKKKVSDACGKAYHPMHCQDVECEKNL